MARIRTIKPEFWKHEALSALPEATHMLAAQLLNYCDDYGYFNANTKLIQAEVSPLREPSVSIHESLVRLQECFYIKLGTGADGRRYGQVVEFQTHQRVAHPTPSKISDLPITWDDLGKPHEKIVNPPETFRPERNREQGKEQGRERNTTAAARPDSEAVERLRFVYPKRAGSQPWQRALKACNARLAEGHGWAEILDGVDRYAAFARTTGIEGTAYVMQAARFCGPEKHFLETWDPPPTSAEVRQNANVQAGRDWLEAENAPF